jgi:exopolysaccharide biosynthesis protein
MRALQHGTFILGRLTPDDVTKLAPTQLLSGFGWLVRNGTAVIDTTTEIAPRTAIGVDKDGRLMILEVDGIEHSTPAQGLTIQQTATWFRDLGAVNAINLDGGGSSVAWYNNTIVDHPTSDDSGRWGERPSTTMTCIKGGPFSAK